MPDDDPEMPACAPRSRRPISRSTTSSGSPTGRRSSWPPDAVDRIRASRAVVDALVDGPTLIYGLNTGLGHLRDVQVPRETLRRYQELIVIGHEGAIGDPLPTEVVRAAIAVRLNGHRPRRLGRQPAGRRGPRGAAQPRRPPGRARRPARSGRRT